MEMNENTINRHLSLKGNNSDELKLAIASLVTNFLKQYGSVEDVRRALSSNRVYWRDNLIKQEQNLAKIIKDTPADKEAKILVANALLDYSEKLILFAHRDIVKPEKRIEKNPVVNIVNAIVNGFDLEDRKKFWMDTFDVQKDIVFDILSANLDKEVDLRASMVFINYSNIMMANLENDKGVVERIKEGIEKLTKMREKAEENINGKEDKPADNLNSRPKL